MPKSNVHAHQLAHQGLCTTMFSKCATGQTVYLDAKAHLPKFSPMMMKKEKDQHAWMKNVSTAPDQLYQSVMPTIAPSSTTVTPTFNNHAHHNAQLASSSTLNLWFAIGQPAYNVKYQDDKSVKFVFSL